MKAVVSVGHRELHAQYVMVGCGGFFAADPITDKNASKSGNLNIILRYFKLLQDGREKGFSARKRARHEFSREQQGCRGAVRRILC